MRSARTLYTTSLRLLILAIACSVVQTGGFLWFAIALERDMARRREAARLAERAFDEARRLMEDEHDG